MKALIKESIQNIISQDLINTEQRKNYVDVLVKLRNEKYVSKSEIQNVMIDFMSLMDNKVNEYLEVSLRMSINYEAIKDRNANFRKYFNEIEKESKEIDQLLDQQNYPK